MVMDGSMPVDGVKVLALLRRMPWVGDRIVFGWQFEALEMDGRHVDKVRTSREPAAEA